MERATRPSLRSMDRKFMVFATFKLAASLDNLRISAVSVDVRRIVLSYNAVLDRATGWSNLIMFRSNNSGFDCLLPS